MVRHPADTRCVVIGLGEVLAPDLSRALVEARALPNLSSLGCNTRPRSHRMLRKDEGKEQAARLPPK